MRTILIILLLATASVAVRAQTTAVLIPPGTPTEITSDSATFDNNTRRLVYLGEVMVSDARVKLHCDRLTVDLPAEGQSRPSRIVAETNLTVEFLDEKGQINHLTAEKAVYVYHVANSVTNWNVTFTGTPGNPPKVETAQFTVTSEPLVRDIAADQYHFTHEIILIKQGVTGGTNTTPFNFLK